MKGRNKKKKEQFDLGQNLFYLFINSPVASRLRNTNLLPYSMRRTFFTVNKHGSENRWETAAQTNQLNERLLAC